MTPARHTPRLRFFTSWLSSKNRRHRSSRGDDQQDDTIQKANFFPCSSVTPYSRASVRALGIDPQHVRAFLLWPPLLSNGENVVRSYRKAAFPCPSAFRQVSGKITGFDLIARASRTSVETSEFSHVSRPPYRERTHCLSADSFLLERRMLFR